MSIIDTLIMDRNEADLSALRSLMAIPFAQWTEEQKEQFKLAMSKGAYNASDLNRVGAAVQYVAERFAAQGYAVAVSPKTNWLASDIPTASELETYRQNIATLRGLIAVMKSTPETPETMRFLDYIKANDIERILLDLDTLLTNAALAWYQSGEIYAGEV